MNGDIINVPDVIEIHIMSECRDSQYPIGRPHNINHRELVLKCYQRSVNFSEVDCLSNSTIIFVDTQGLESLMVVLSIFTF